MSECLENLRQAAPIEGWPDCFVTPDGRVFRVSEITPSDNGNGYLYVKVMNEGKTSNSSVHRLVATAFVENPQQLKTVDHIDGDKKNNRKDNLQWYSLKDNVRKHFKGDYKLVCPKGVVYSFQNLREFCERHGLDNSTTSKVLRGLLQHTRGWRAVPKEETVE